MKRCFNFVWVGDVKQALSLRPIISTSRYGLQFSNRHQDDQGLAAVHIAVSGSEDLPRTQTELLEEFQGMGRFHSIDWHASDYNGRTALHYAFDNTQSEATMQALQFLCELSQPLDINTRDYAGRSALFDAVHLLPCKDFNQKQALVQFLLDNGAR